MTRNRWGTLGAPLPNPAPNLAFVVHIGSRKRPRAIVGFRQPSFKFPEGKGENQVREGEIRVAPNCIAVLDYVLDKEAFYRFDRREGAKHIAGEMKRVSGVKARVIAVHVEPEKRKGKRTNR
jgi:hypothetical protein